MANLHEVFLDVAEHHPGTVFVGESGIEGSWPIESLIEMLSEDLGSMKTKEKKEVLSNRYAWHIEPLGDQLLIGRLDTVPGIGEVFVIKYKSAR